MFYLLSLVDLKDIRQVVIYPIWNKDITENYQVTMNFFPYKTCWFMSTHDDSSYFLL
jgi:hypothetical protein